MRHITLTDAEEQGLKCLYHTGAKSYIRQRAQCILLSNRGYSIPTLADIFSTRTHTVREWFNRWESEGFKGLEIRSGRGLKPAIRIEDTALVTSIQKTVEEHPQNLKEAVAKLNTRHELNLSERQLRTFLKKS